MKKNRAFITTVIAVMLQSFGIRLAGAQQTNQLIFPALLSATSITTNEQGLVYKQISNQDLISDCAGDKGITNFTGLLLVYNLTSNALAVVAPTNLTSVGTNHVLLGTNLYFICTPLSFMNLVWLSDTNTNTVELLAAVFDETNTMASGTLAATERFQYGVSNQITAFSLIGRIQYSAAASGTNSAAIYRGVFVAGNAVMKPGGGGECEQGENEEGHHGERGNGHHGDDQGNGDDGNHGNGHHGHHG